jgi:serine/threonine-protein kinase HipA
MFYEKGVSHFEYHADFLSRNLNISPFKLAITSDMQTAKRSPFNGLFGVFNDSLPDGWGLLLMDKWFRQQGMPLADITPLTRLTYIGERGLGALSYHPEITKNEGSAFSAVDIQQLARESIAIYQGQTSSVLAELTQAGVPSGGARPKVLLGINAKDEAVVGDENLPEGYTRWLAKFPTGDTYEKRCEGKVEYVYSCLAKDAGIAFPDTRLIKGDAGHAYFAVERFDRTVEGNKVHMHSLAGLIDADFRIPDCDYEVLMKVTNALTKSHKENIEVFRRLVFNVVMGNRDDHTKNFCFLMNNKGLWRSSPAYDLTYNLGINGNHSMSVAGEGKNIRFDHLAKIAGLGSINKKCMREIIEQVSESALRWKAVIKNYDVPSEIVGDIEQHIHKQTALIRPS